MIMKKKRCLIFGSNGFIAKNFANNKQINKNFDILVELQNERNMTVLGILSDEESNRIKK